MLPEENLERLWLIYEDNIGLLLNLAWLLAVISDPYTKIFLSLDIGNIQIDGQRYDIPSENIYQPIDMVLHNLDKMRKELDNLLTGDLTVNRCEQCELNLMQSALISKDKIEELDKTIKTRMST